MNGERNTVTLAGYGLETGQLGLRIYADQQVIETPTIRKMNEVLNSAAPSVGLRLTSGPLTPKPGFWRWLGVGLDRGLDAKTYSLSSESGVILPLWLMAVLLALRPVRYFRERLRTQAAAGDDPAGRRDRGALMRIVIAMVAGLAVGVAAMFFVMRHPSTAAQISATNRVAEQAPIHPIVGVWRIHFDPIVATYTFGNDGKFILVFRGVPRQHAYGAIETHTEGTWKVEANALTMHNTATDSEFSVVGDDESATIESIAHDTLVLSRTDKAGKSEKMTFERVTPFAKGKFDNPALLGHWRSDRTFIELKDSGDATVGSTQMRPNHVAPQRTAAWSQSGARLTMQIDAPAPPRRGYGGQPPPALPPSEMVYEVMNVSPDGNMLLLKQVQPPQTPVAIVTYYRVN